MGVSLRDVESADAARIAAIYNHYVRHTTVTFEEADVSSEVIVQRCRAVAEHDLPWLVAEGQTGICGYAYATPWRARAAYRNSVEVTVYVDHQAVGGGVGTLLYQALFDALERAGLHVAIGGITLPNAPSIALHEKLGMRKVAHFEEVGFKFGRWLDVGYWQRTLTSG